MSTFWAIFAKVATFSGHTGGIAKTEDLQISFHGFVILRHAAVTLFIKRLPNVARGSGFGDFSPFGRLFQSFGPIFCRLGDFFEPSCAIIGNLGLLFNHLGHILPFGRLFEPFLAVSRQLGDFLCLFGPDYLTLRVHVA